MTPELKPYDWADDPDIDADTVASVLAHQHLRHAVLKGGPRPAHAIPTSLTTMSSPRWVCEGDLPHHYKRAGGDSGPLVERYDWAGPCADSPDHTPGDFALWERLKQCCCGDPQCGEAR